MKFIKIALTSLVIMTGVSLSAQKKIERFEKLEIEMFPKAKEGYKQVYIQLPIEMNENDLKVEYFVGADRMVDCNQQSIMGSIKKKDVEGWGYSYFDVDSKGESMTTLMGCPDQKKTKKFVTLQPEITRYNSRLPLVFYIPKDLEVRYRILKPESDLKKATQK